VGSAAAPVTLQQLRDSWPEIVEVVQKARRTAWMVVVTATVVDFADDVLTLAFPSANDVESFKRPQGAAEGVSEYLRRAIVDVLGVKVKYIARVEGDGPAGPTPAGAPVAETSTPTSTTGGRQATEAEPAAAPAAPTPAAAEPAAAAPAAVAPSPAATPPAAAPATPAAAAEPAARSTSTRASGASAPSPEATSGRRPAGSAPVTGWDVAPIPQSAPPEPDEPEHITEEPPGGVPTVDAAPPPAEAVGTPVARPAGPPSPTTSAPSTPSASAGPSVAERRAATGDPRRGIPTGSRYGEAVVREILGAQFIEEETIAPRVTPQRSE
jgi:DNA polymerase-3 subunit gamma/tau